MSSLSNYYSVHLSIAYVSHELLLLVYNVKQDNEKCSISNPNVKSNNKTRTKMTK